MHPKYDIYKFCDLKPKLGHDNWISWKRELLAMVRDQGLYSSILGTDIFPITTNETITMTNNIAHVGTTPLSDPKEEWHDHNNTAYNQILLCISPELQTVINAMDVVSKAWKILIKKFESTDPSKISIIRMKYKNYHMTEGQSVVMYLTTMKEFWSQLQKMGEMIADSTHAVTIL